MRNRRNTLLFFLLTFAAAACVEPYEPAILAEDHNYLVVEGFLNSGNEPSVIKLSRTTGLNETAGVGVHMEESAMVSVESEKGSVYPLQQASDGTYVLEPLDLDNQDRYRLRIKTNNGKEYFSEFTEVKETPPIDSISWNYKPEGVSILVNTHDPQNNSWYYRWEYEEAWEVVAPHKSVIKYEGGEIIDREKPTPVYCWKYNSSANIIIGSSAKLEQDIISQRLITFVPKADRRISSRYSILVKQYALGKEAFRYYQQMEKNSEQRGSFFDPQPMELNGNIYNPESPDEPVIGFFSVGSVQEKRIFIKNSDVLDPYWGFRLDCDEITVPPDEFNVYLTGAYDPIYIDMQGNAIAVRSVCVDCSRFGNPERPLFWE